MRMKLILEAEHDDMILAMRAGQSLLKHPSTQNDMMVAFGNDGGKTKDFYVKRNKNSISVRQMDAP